MASLVDLQRRLRDAVVVGDVDSVVPLLIGGLVPAKRLAIHRRHFEASLTAAVVGRFPATAWLVGASRLDDAARRFVHEHPPTAPCIGEYGLDFPAFLGTWPATAHLEYVPEFAALDWHLGRLAISADEAPLTREQFVAQAPDDLENAGITFQAGTHYLAASWPIDALMAAYLAETAPESWTLVDEPVWIEARGSRGSLRFLRLDAAGYAFRRALVGGNRLGVAANMALALDPTFDPGAALLTLVSQGLIISIIH